jgi:putative chitinase
VPGTAPAPAAVPSSGGTEPLQKKISAAAGKKALLEELDNQKITDPVKRAAIMAQAAVETGGFTALSENLAYSAEGMKKTFGRLKDTPIEVLKEAISKGVAGIGSLIYGGDPSSPSYNFGVKNLGNVQPGDGFRYRGRGFFQLTGRANYTKAGVADAPYKLLELGPAAQTAVDFANRFKGDYGDVSAFTKFVNGGQIHVKERGEFFQQFLNDPQITKVGAAAGITVNDASTSVAAAKQNKAKAGGGSTTVVVVADADTKKAPQNAAPRTSQPLPAIG